MPRPSHLMVIAFAAAAFYPYATASDSPLLALLVKPVPVLALIAWLYSAPAAPYLIILLYWLGQWLIATSVHNGKIGKVLTQSGARPLGSC